MNEDPLQKEVDELKESVKRPTRVTEGSFPDRKPSKPINVITHGGIETIQLYWDYADEIFIKHYEVYGSQIKDFVPDTQHLSWRGQVSAFAHTVGTEQKWYYRIRAMNYHGTASDWSDQVEVSTKRILTEDILFGEEMAERLRDLNRISDIIGEGGISLDNLHDDIPDYMKQQAKEYTDDEIFLVKDFLDDKLYEFGDTFVNIDRRFDDVEGVLSDKVERGIFDDFTDSYEYDMAQLNIKYDEISTSVSNIRIGGRNLLKYTNFDNQSNIDRLVTSGFPSSSLSPLKYEMFDLTFAYTFLSNQTEGTNYRVFMQPRGSLSLSEGETYTLSWYAYSVRLNTSFNETYIAVDGSIAQRLNNVERRHIVDAETSSGAARPIYRYTVTFTFNQPSTNLATISVGSKVSSDGAVTYALAGVQLEYGNMASDWSINPDDVDERMTISETTIRQLSGDILLKVDVDNIVSEINLKKEGIRIAGDLIHLDGLTLIDDAIIQATHIADAVIEKAHLGRAIIDDAHIDELTGNKFVANSINADRLNVSQLSAVSGNMGTLRSGILQSDNNNMYLNLNTGELTMRNAHFTLGGGATIIFESTSNQVTYSRYSSTNVRRTAGLGVGTALGNEHPYAYLGTTPLNNGVIDTLHADFTGLIVNTSNRIREADAANTIVGNRTRFISSTSYEKGITFDWFGNSPDIRTQNPTTYDYYIGTFRRIYGKQTIDFRHYFNTSSGWLMETNYEGGGRDIMFRGLNTQSYNYQIGSSGARIRNIFLSNNPNVSSDERLKTEISDLNLGLDFIKELEAKQFRLKLTSADINQGKLQNVLQYGIIAQQVKSTLVDFGVSENSLINEGEDGLFGAQYEQFIPILIQSDKDLDIKFTDEVTRIEGLTKDNSVEIQMMKVRIKQLEGKIA